MSDREIGTVKWFNNARGYGFITKEEEGDDIFVHYRNIRGDGYRSLAEGQLVEFELQHTDKGLHADDVAKVEGANSVQQQKQVEVEVEELEA